MNKLQELEKLIKEFDDFGTVLSAPKYISGPWYLDVSNDDMFMTIIW